jgi:site-specific DNA recombinase
MAVESSRLAAKLFDQASEWLTPSHAIKDGRRYRYYVSQGLASAAAEPGRGWRLAAAGACARADRRRGSERDIE